MAWVAPNSDRLTETSDGTSPDRPPHSLAGRKLHVTPPLVDTSSAPQLAIRCASADFDAELKPVGA